MKATLRPFVAVALVLLTGIANAETWPTRPIKFVVPFGPGIGYTNSIDPKPAPRG